MKLLLAFVLALATFATALASPVMGPDGVLRYHVGGRPPIVRCPVNMLCDIALVRTDRISPSRPPVAGDMTDFDIKVTAGPAPHVFVVPLKASVSTTLVVFTTTASGHQRTYHFFIQSVPNMGQTTGVNIGFFDDNFQPPAPVVILQAPATPDPNPLAAIDLRTLHCNPHAYAIRGTAPFRPLRICTDAVRTYIQVGTLAEVPALLGANDRWQSRSINYGYHDGYFVVPAHDRRFMLVLGTGKAQETVTIERR